MPVKVVWQFVTVSMHIYAMLLLGCVPLCCCALCQGWFISIKTHVLVLDIGGSKCGKIKNSAPTKFRPENGDKLIYKFEIDACASTPFIFVPMLCLPLPQHLHHPSVHLFLPILYKKKQRWGRSSPSIFCPVTGRVCQSHPPPHTSPSTVVLHPLSCGMLRLSSSCFHSGHSCWPLPTTTTTAAATATTTRQCVGLLLLHIYVAGCETWKRPGPYSRVTCCG